MAGDKLDCETTSKLKSIYARKVKMPFVCSGRFEFSSTYEKLERAAFASVEKCMAEVTTTTKITTKKAHTHRRMNNNNSTCSNRFNEYSYFVCSCRRTRAPLISPTNQETMNQCLYVRFAFCRRILRVYINSFSPMHSSRETLLH